MKTTSKLITPLITGACLALLGPIQADDKDKSNRTITLVCDEHGFGGRPAGPTMIDLNEAEGVATIREGGVISHSGEILGAGHITGPLKARFTKNTITFVLRTGDRVDDFTINRLTGIVDIIWTEKNKEMLRYQYTCHVGNAQF